MNAAYWVAEYRLYGGHGEGIIFAYKAHRLALGPRAPGAADAMHIVLRFVRKIKVYDV